LGDDFLKQFGGTTRLLQDRRYCASMVTLYCFSTEQKLCDVWTDCWVFTARCCMSLNEDN